MNIQAIAGAVFLVPVDIRDRFFDVIEEFIKDKSTGIVERTGMAIMTGVRALTNTEDLPDEDKTFTALVEDVLEEAATTANSHVPKIQDVLKEMVDDYNNPLKDDDLPEALKK